jgi:hypothetical protein
MQSIVSLHYIKTCRIAKQESFDSDKSRVFHLRGSARVCRNRNSRRALITIIADHIPTPPILCQSNRSGLATSPSALQRFASPSPLVRIHLIGPVRVGSRPDYLSSAPSSPFPERAGRSRVIGRDRL